MKTCSKCGDTKEYSEFWKDKNRSDGLFPQCKSCVTEYRAKNKHLKSNHNKNYRDNHKDEASKYYAIWYLNN
ncbi:unnamed protein product, partial [marine sediment metagenome]